MSDDEDDDEDDEGDEDEGEDGDERNNYDILEIISLLAFSGVLVCYFITIGAGLIILELVAFISFSFGLVILILLTILEKNFEDVILRIVIISTMVGSGFDLFSFYGFTWIIDICCICLGVIGLWSLQQIENHNSIGIVSSGLGFFRLVIFFISFYNSIDIIFWIILLASLLLFFFSRHQSDNISFEREMEEEDEERQPQTEQDRMAKLKKLVRVSKSLKISQMADMLGLNVQELNYRIVDWADQFGFELDQDVVIFGAGKKDDFINALDGAFTDWGKKTENKEGKLE